MRKGDLLKTKSLELDVGVGDVPHQLVGVLDADGLPGSVLYAIAMVAQGVFFTRSKSPL